MLTGRLAAVTLGLALLVAPARASTGVEAELCRLLVSGEAPTEGLTVKLVREKLPEAARQPEARASLMNLVPQWLGARPPADLPKPDDVATLVEGLIQGYWSVDDAIAIARAMAGPDERSQEAVKAALWAWYQGYAEANDSPMMSAADLLRLQAFREEPNGFRSVTRDLDVWTTLYLGNDNRRHYTLLEVLKGVGGWNHLITADAVRLDVASQTIAASALQDTFQAGENYKLWKARVGDMAATYRVPEKDLKTYVANCAKSAPLREAIAALDKYYAEIFRGSIPLRKAFSHNPFVLVLAHARWVEPNEARAGAARRALNEAIPARKLPSLVDLEKHLEGKFQGKPDAVEKLGAFLGEAFPAGKPRDVVFVMPGSEEVEMSGTDGKMTIKWQGRNLFVAPELLKRAWTVHEGKERNAALFSFSPQLHRAAVLHVQGKVREAEAEVREIQDYRIGDSLHGGSEEAFATVWQLLEDVATDEPFRLALLKLLGEAQISGPMPVVQVPGPQDTEGLNLWTHLGQMREGEPEKAAAAARAVTKLLEQGAKSDVWSVAISKLDLTDSALQSFYLLRALKTTKLPLSLSKRNAFIALLERSIETADRETLVKRLDEKNDASNQVLASQIACVWVASDLKAEEGDPVLLRAMDGPDGHVISEAIRAIYSSKERATRLLPKLVEHLGGLHRQWTSQPPLNGKREAMLEAIRYGIDVLHLIAHQQPDMKEEVRKQARAVLVAIMSDASFQLDHNQRALETLSFLYGRPETLFRIEDGNRIVPVEPFE